MGSAIQVASFGFIRMCLFQILTWQFLRFREGGYRLANRYVQKELAIIFSQSESEVLPGVGVGFLDVVGGNKIWLRLRVSLKTRHRLRLQITLKNRIFEQNSHRKTSN